jgi:diaminopimelate decarboxylase
VGSRRRLDGGVDARHEKPDVRGGQEKHEEAFVSSLSLPLCLSVSGDVLNIEECSVPALVARFGSPLYVLSEAQLRRNARRIRAAFEAAWEGPVQILPSIKANNALALRSILSQEGFGCDTFGPAELHAALAGGTSPEMVSLNGSFKDRDLVARGIEAGVRITIDSAPELTLCEEEARRLRKVAKVRLRVRLWLPHLLYASEIRRDGIPMSIGYQIAKYGVPTDEVGELGLRALGSEHIELTGFHFHSGRHTTDPGAWASIAKGYAAEVIRLSKLWGNYVPREIDMGGGIPSPVDPVARRIPEVRDRPAPPAVEQYAASMASTLRQALVQEGMDPSRIVFQVEPGRSLYGSAGIHVAKVVNVKRSRTPFEFTWVGLDTSQMFLGSTIIESSSYPLIVANKAGQAAEWTADIVGRTCLVDRIIPGALVPPVEVQDTVAFVGTGAYDDALASNFNGLPRPATVLVSNQEAEVIKRAETIEDVFRRDVVPTRLRKSTAAAG